MNVRTEPLSNHERIPREKIQKLNSRVKSQVMGGTLRTVIVTTLCDASASMTVNAEYKAHISSMAIEI